MKPLLLSITAFLFCGLAGTSSRGAQKIATEPKTRLLSAGHGQKPFDVTRHTIPLSRLEGGGDELPRDGIPALVNPRFATPAGMKHLLKGSDAVLGVVLNGEAKAYPLRILNWHEVVNDQVGGRPILVSW